MFRIIIIIIIILPPRLELLLVLFCFFSVLSCRSLRSIFVLISDLSLLLPPPFHEAIIVLFLGALTHAVYVYFVVCVCYANVCGSLSVSAENLAKCLMQMERQLLQLEKELETFSSHDDPTDMFFTKMAISF